MKNILKLILIFPILLELLDSSRFVIELPIPLSFARVLLLLLSFYFILGNIFKIFSDRIFNSFLIIFLSILLASILKGSFEMINKSIGQILLLISSFGFVFIFTSNFLKKIIRLFFIINFVYWVSITYISIFGNTFFDFSFYTGYTTEQINHHTVGIPILISSIFIYHYYFFTNGKYSLNGNIFLIISLGTMFLIENRSGLLCLAATFMALNFSKIKKFNSILPLSVFSILVFFSVLFLFQFEPISQRFNLYDTDYIQRTTDERVFLYSQFFPTFFNNIFGLGSDAYVDFYFQKILIHNQYLTFILAGGIFSVYSVYRFLLDFYILGKKIISKKIDNLNKMEISLFLSTIPFFIKLFFLEQGGLIFFFCLSIVIYINLKLKNKLSI